MNDTIKQLIKVQDKDERIANLRRIVDSVPQDKERIATELRGTEERLTDAKTALQKIQSKIKDIENDVQSAQDRITQLNVKSAGVKKNDEYRAIMNEIENLRSQISKKETEQLELMDSVGHAQSSLDDALKESEAADKRIKAAQEDLNVRAKNCQAQIEKIQVERDELAAAVSAADMLRYSRLTAQSNGVAFRMAVVPIEGKNCGSCHLSIPPDKRNKAMAGTELVTCGQCGAILYVETN